MCIHEIGKEREPSVCDTFTLSRRRALEAALQRYSQTHGGVLIKDSEGDIVLWKDVLEVFNV